MTQPTTPPASPASSTSDGPPVAWAVAILVGLSLPFMFLGLGSYSAVNGDEVNYQMMALTMVRSGDWLTLMNGDHPRVYDTYMNAPLQYWWRATAITLFGNSEWTMRIHSALFGLATVLITYRVALLVAGRRAAFIAGLALITTFQFLFLHSARTGETETPLLFLFVAAAYLFMRAVEDPERGFVLHHFCFIGILSLKLPVVLIPTLAELACFAASARARARFSRWFWTGVAVLPVGLSWHFYQAATHFDDARRTFLEMQSHAGQSVRLGIERGGVANLKRYGPILLFGAFPTALAYPIALTGLIRERLAWKSAKVRLDEQGASDEEIERASLRQERIQTLLLYVGAIALFYVMIAKRGPWYPMPLYPFLAILLGIWLADLSRAKPGNGVLAALAIALALVITLVPEIASYNPFAEPAFTIPMRTHWREFSGVTPWIVVPVLAALVFAGLVRARSMMGARFAPVLVAGFTALLIGYSGVRCVAALRYLGHRSEIGALRESIDRQRDAGSVLDFPIAAPQGHNWILRYYFWEDFVIRPGERDPRTSRPLDANAAYLLYERGQIGHDGKQVPPPRPLTEADRVRLGLE